MNPYSFSSHFPESTCNADALNPTSLWGHWSHLLWGCPISNFCTISQCFFLQSFLLVCLSFFPGTFPLSCFYTVHPDHVIVTCWCWHININSFVLQASVTDSAKHTTSTKSFSGDEQFLSHISNLFPKIINSLTIESCLFNLCKKETSLH